MEFYHGSRFFVLVLILFYFKAGSKKVSKFIEKSAYRNKTNNIGDSSLLNRHIK